MNFKKIPWVIRAIFYSIFTDIGFPSYIGSPMYISRLSNLKIGKKVRIYPGMRAEIETSNSFISIGRNTSIGQNFHIVSYNDNLIIGANVTISANVMITNCDHSYKTVGAHILDQPLIKKKTCIGDNCFIGYGAIIQAGSVLGKQCIVGANTVVRGSFSDYCVIVGIPGKVVRKFNKSTEKWETVM